MKCLADLLWPRRSEWPGRGHCLCSRRPWLCSGPAFAFVLRSVPLAGSLRCPASHRTVVHSPRRLSVAWPTPPRHCLSQPPAAPVPCSRGGVRVPHPRVSPARSGRVEGDLAFRAHLTGPLPGPPAHPTPGGPRSLAQALERGLRFSPPDLRVLGTGRRGCEGPSPLLLRPSLKRGLLTW